MSNISEYTPCKVEFQMQIYFYNKNFKSITRLRTLSYLFLASPEAAGWFLLSGHMDHISLVTIPVFGCVTSEQKPPLRIRKYLFIQELCNFGNMGTSACFSVSSSQCCPVSPHSSESVAVLS